MNNFSCAFAGHNPLRYSFGYDEEDELCLLIKKKILQQILDLYENGVTIFYSNCEVGASMWGAELTLELMKRFPELKLHCVIPFEEQAKKWTPPLRDRYYNILEKCTNNYLISTNFTKDCYLRCNQYLVNHAGFILAVYDNDPILKMEPVTQLITYARKKKRGIISIHPDTAEVTPITIKAET